MGVVQVLQELVELAVLRDELLDAVTTSWIVVHDARDLARAHAEECSVALCRTWEVVRCG
jgi:hypothetical protein